MADRPGEHREPSWIELMGRHAASAVLSFSARVTTVQDGESSVWQVWHGRGDRWRVERGDHPVYLFDGATAVVQQDGRMRRLQGDFHLPLLGRPGPMAFVGGHSLMDNLSRNIAPGPTHRGTSDGREVFTVDITHDNQPHPAHLMFDAMTGLLLRFHVDGVDRMRVEGLVVHEDVPDETFQWDGEAEDAPPVDRDGIRRRARQIPWIQVLVQMVHGPTPPVRGVLRSVDEDGGPKTAAGWVSVGDAPPPTVAAGVDTETVSVWKDGDRVRIERPDGTPVLISDGTTCWRFRDNEIPTRAPASTVLFRGNGTELLTRRPAAEWLGNDFTRLAGSIEMTQWRGRSVYEFDLAPPPHKPHALHMVVDTETGLVLSQGVPAVGTIVEWTEFEVVDSHDDSLFAYTGPSEPAEERAQRRRQAHNSDRERRLAWFSQNVTAQRLTTQIEVGFDVTYVHELDEETGAFYASLGDRVHSGSLVRRVHSDESWDHGSQDGARTWTSGGFDWAFLAYDTTLTDAAFEILRRKIDRT